VSRLPSQTDITPGCWDWRSHEKGDCLSPCWHQSVSTYLLFKTELPYWNVTLSNYCGILRTMPRAKDDLYHVKIALEGQRPVFDRS